MRLHWLNRIVIAARIEVEVERRIEELLQWLRAQQGVVVAYSGGVDSTLVAAAASRALGAKAIAVTADSAIYPTEETKKATEFARKLELRHRVIRTRELDRPKFAENSPLRCYHCKQELFERLFEIAREESLPVVVDGCHNDDSTDFRPGAKAARELGILSPLAELDFTKDEIRAVSHEMGLPNWDKPAHPCLSTRFAYGMKITEDRLREVEDAEGFLKALGVGDLRIRSHGDVARIEVRPEDFSFFVDGHLGPKIVSGLKARGYRYVTLDLEGFRSGSMNETLVQGGWTRAQSR